MYRDIVCKIDGDQMFGAIFLAEPAQAARPVPPQRSGRIPAQMAGFHHGRAIPGLTSQVAAGRLASTLLQVSVSTDEKGNTGRNRSRPAAVTGDEFRTQATVARTALEGAERG